MKKFEFSFYMNEKDVSVIKVAVNAKDLDTAKKIVNSQITAISPRKVFDWFPDKEENTFIGMRVYC